MELDLNKLQEAVERPTRMIENQPITDIIVAIGNTGSGKSTLIQALLNGPDSLEDRKVKVVLQDPSSEQPKTAWRKQIDIKNETGKGPKIGHDQMNSQTVYPDFYRIDDTNQYLVDVAGFDDTGIDLIKLVIALSNRALFKKVVNVKILLTLTNEQITGKKGLGVRKFIEDISNMFQGTMDQIVHSILPIITKVKPSDQDFDYEITLASIYESCSTYLQNRDTQSLYDLDRFQEYDEMLKEYDQLKEKDNGNHLEGKEQDDDISDELRQFKHDLGKVSLDDFFKDYHEMKSLKSFLDQFAGNFLVCDPLDRPFDGELGYTDEYNVRISGLIKVNDLKRKLLGLKPFRADLLSIQLSEPQVDLIIR